MESQKERRIYHRVPVRLTAICHKVGQSPGRIYTANTVDVSSGGMLMEMNTCDLDEGQLLSVDMSLPPTEGLLEFGGRFSTYARVLRVESCEDDHPDTHRRFGRQIALEFCQSMRLQV
jgi:hypothetical protein